MSSTLSSSSTATQYAELIALKARLDDCLLQDALRLKGRLDGLERRARQGKPVDRGLAEITKRLQASQEKLFLRRNQTVSLNYPTSLPVVEHREELLKALESHQVVVVAGETGSGKTTQLPKMCLELGLGRRGLIGHTQPRRLAARSVSTRLAEELEVTLGEQVGYQIRFTDQTNERTLVKLMTDGILLAETQQDPDLSRYEAIIIDEAHERSLNIDFLLGYLKRLMTRRPDLKIIITSATIDVERFAAHFATPQPEGGPIPAPVVQVSGRTYPVDVHYRPLVREADDEDDRTLQEGILHAMEEIEVVEREKRWLNGPRDVLIFLPGEREIRETADTLRRADLRHTEVLPLYARLSNAEQNRVFQPHNGRRIVLSTNVAETSLTVPGIRYVIDPGLVRISRYSYRAKVQRLPIEPVSQASADQRKGRCGRIAEGLCIRLYSEEDFLARPEFTEPEIQRTNLASVILSMLSLKLGDIAAFPFVDAPDSRFIKDGFRLLFELGAVDEGNRLTTTGRRLARLPIDPRLARMVLAGAEGECLREVLVVVSALSVQDPRERPAEKRQAADQAHKRWEDPDSDFVAWLNLWAGFERAREDLSGNQLRRWCREHYINYMRVREWHDTYRQLRQLLRDMDIHLPAMTRPVTIDPEKADEADRTALKQQHVRLHQALLTGLLSNIGQFIENREYLGARNRRFMIHPGSGLAKKTPKWIMAGELVETSRLFARQAARIQPEWIEPLADQLTKRSYSEPHWEMKRAQVVAFEQVTLFGLPIVSRRKVHYGPIAPQEAREIFIRRALVEGEYRTKAEFFSFNRALIDEVENLEDRARKRDILVDEETLFDFYDQLLPEGIVNGKGFEHWRRKAEADDPKLLKLDKATLLARSVDDISDVQYPDTLVLNGVSYPLSYHFAPDAEDDGVTMTVPATMLSQLPRHRLDWLVPGLLREKCIALLKSLPKSVRRQVVPIPDWVDAALAAMAPANVPLTEALGEFLRVKTGLRLAPEDWRREQLPPHLSMNLRVVDHEGKFLGQGRDLSELERRFFKAAKAGAQALSETADASEEVDGLPATPLAESYSTIQAGIRVAAYPALVEGKPRAALDKSSDQNSDKRSDKGLAIALFDHPDRAREAHRHGIKRLAMQRLPDQVKSLKCLKGLDRCALLFAKTGSKAQLIEDLVEAVFLHEIAFDPLPRSQEDFEARLAAQRDKLVPYGESLIGTLHKALEGHLAVTQALKGNLSMALALVYGDLKAQMQRLVYPGFISDAGDWLNEYPRYMQAAQIRLEKAPRERMRDQMMMQQVQDFESRLANRRKAQQQNGDEALALDEFGWWLEELRVSLFAQQLGTREPVSAKRLERRWAEITGRG